MRKGTRRRNADGRRPVRPGASAGRRRQRPARRLHGGTLAQYRARGAPAGGADRRGGGRCPGTTASVSPLSPPVTVRLGTLPTVSDAGMYLAMERGYFAAEGIQIDPIPFDSAAQMVAPLGAGQLDVGGGSTSAGLYNAIARGLPLKIVADKGSMPPGFGWIGLIVRRDLADQIRDYPDLRGRKIAINQTGTTNDIALEAALKRGGLTWQDVEVLQMPFADMNSALTNRSVDAAQQNEPFKAIAIEEGIATSFRGVDAYAPNIQFSVILYAPHFVRDHRRRRAAGWWRICAGFAITTTPSASSRARPRSCSIS